MMNRIHRDWFPFNATLVPSCPNGGVMVAMRPLMLYVHNTALLVRLNVCPNSLVTMATCPLKDPSYNSVMLTLTHVVTLVQLSALQQGIEQLVKQVVALLVMLGEFSHSRKQVSFKVPFVLQDVKHVDTF